MSKFSPFYNPAEWVRSIIYARKSRHFDKATSDLELSFYSKILSNDMLHYGYFENKAIRAEDISFQIFEDAQLRYAHKILEQLVDKTNPVLDIGCGMGGIARLIHEKAYSVECLTPNLKQINYIKKNQPHLKTFNTRFENFHTDKKYGSLVNAESLQYIPLDSAFSKADDILLTGGKWIITDYFRKKQDSNVSKPHILDEFINACEKFRFSIVIQEDMTEHIMPTLEFINIYVNRFLYPLKDLGYEKFRIKKPGLYYLSHKLRAYIDNKINKEVSTVDPSIFSSDRTYQLFVLEKMK